ncbi:MAG: hypothetical protein JNL70_25825 [Saprospiraceae bacterium]|nr:hypothetical protein [Saprospiraceae bacterium]
MTPCFYAFYVGLIRIEIRQCVNGWQYKAWHGSFQFSKGEYFETAEFAERLGRDVAEDCALYGIPNNL